MNSKIQEIRDKIEIERNILNSFFEDDSIDISSTEIYNQSVKIDNLITEYFEAQSELDKERGIIMYKYEKLLNQPFKHEIIGNIRTEVRKDNPNIGIKELEYFSINVYIYTCLLAHGIKEQDIIEQLIYINNNYFDEIKEEEPVTPEGKSKVTNSLEYLKNLKEKYTKIIKERI